MQFTTVLLALLASTAIALPGGKEGGKATSTPWTSSTCKATYTKVPVVVTKSKTEYKETQYKTEVPKTYYETKYGSFYLLLNQESWQTC